MSKYEEKTTRQIPPRTKEQKKKVQDEDKRPRQTDNNQTTETKDQGRTPRPMIKTKDPLNPTLSLYQIF
jgi:hypothetical protein